MRLQCYEGLDTASAVYEWNYTRQMIEILTMLDNLEIEAGPNVEDRTGLACETRKSSSLFCM